MVSGADDLAVHDVGLRQVGAAVRAVALHLVGAPVVLEHERVVRAVGCLSAAANDAWTLDRASSPRPVRSRIVSGTTPEELKASAAQTLGTQTFPLMSVTPKGASLAGHKVQVKGVLTRQKTLERINVMSLDSVGSTCGG